MFLSFLFFIKTCSYMSVCHTIHSVRKKRVVQKFYILCLLLFIICRIFVVPHRHNNFTTSMVNGSTVVRFCAPIYTRKYCRKKVKICNKRKLVTYKTLLLPISFLLTQNVVKILIYRNFPSYSV